MNLSFSALFYLYSLPCSTENVPKFFFSRVLKDKDIIGAEILEDSQALGSLENRMMVYLVVLMSALRIMVNNLF